MNFFLIAERVRKLPFFFSPFMFSFLLRQGKGCWGVNSDVLKLWYILSWGLLQWVPLRMDIQMKWFNICMCWALESIPQFKRVNHALQSAEYGSCTWSMNNFSKTIIVYARIIAICKAPVELRGSIVTTHAIEMHLKWLYSHKISLFCRMARNMMGAGIKLLALTSLQFWHEWPEVYKWKTYWTERLFVYP